MSRGGFVTIALAGLLLLAWSLVVPIFEAPDEPAHWQYARYLHDRHRLPILGPDFVEAHSPPLPYLLMAPVATDTATPAQLASIDAQGRPIIPDPPHTFANAPDDLRRYWPIRFARLLNVGVAVALLVVCYYAGLAATGRKTTGVLTAGLVAFLPQFTFRAMNVSDDTLMMLGAALTTALLVRIVRQGFSWRLGFLAAAAIALACLSKTLTFFYPALFALTVLTERGSGVRRAARLAPLLLTALLMAPWLARNVALYGDFLGFTAMREAFPLQFTPRSPFSRYFVTAFPRGLLASFLGKFGWMNLRMPLVAYGLYAILAAAVVWGFAHARLSLAKDRRLLLVLVSFPIANLLLLAYINLSFTQPQGRYLFPALPAIMLLAALGLERLPGWSARYAIALVAALGLLNAAILGFVVYPAYWG